MTETGAFQSEHRSMLVNYWMEKAHHFDFIEKAGTGIRRIRDDVREQGCPAPKFEIRGFFTVVFRPNPAVRTEAVVGDTRLPHVRDHVTEQVTAHVDAYDEAHEPIGRSNKTFWARAHKVQKQFYRGRCCLLATLLFSYA